ncbi:unnamed protein product, partial [Musa textilis]
YFLTYIVWHLVFPCVLCRSRNLNYSSAVSSLASVRCSKRWLVQTVFLKLTCFDKTKTPEKKHQHIKQEQNPKELCKTNPWGDTRSTTNSSSAKVKCSSPNKKQKKAEAEVL